MGWGVTSCTLAAMAMSVALLSSRSAEASAPEGGLLARSDRKDREMRHALSLPLLPLAPGAPAQDATPTFPSEARVVIIDVVVTDLKGEPVADLRQDELQVLEDGKACDVRSFRPVRPAARPASAPVAPKARGAAPGATRAAATPPARTSLVVLLFDRLRLVDAPLVRQGALDFLDRDLPPHTLFAVYQIRYGARLLAPFTAERARLRAAVDQATLASTDTPQAGPPLTAAEAADEEDGWKKHLMALDRLNAVVGIVRTLSEMEGRRTIVYFARGWDMWSDDWWLYDEAVNTANSLDVVIHTADALGLSAQNPVELTPMDSVLNSFRADSRNGLARGAKPPRIEANAGLVAGGPALRGTEKRAQALFGSVLQQLADATGGLAIANTNDLGTGLTRVADELSRYYEVVYVPWNTTEDGRFRRIRVKVSRRGVKVRTRRGYFATPGRGTPLPTYELPLMAALAAEMPAHDFSLRARVLDAPPTGADREYVVVVDVPLSEVQVVPDEADGLYRAHLTLLGYLKDKDGGVIARLSRDWPIEGPLGEMEQARLRSATLRVALPLAPGRYLLDIAVGDRNGGGTSVTHTPFEVP